MWIFLMKQNGKYPKPGVTPVCHSRRDLAVRCLGCRALHVLFTVSKHRVPITPQIILQDEWENALWLRKENIFLSSLGKYPHVHSDRFNVLKGLLTGIDSSIATAHGMLCVPSLTSAFSVSRTFCPLISRWITLCWCRWLRPWRNERRES